jgi:DNA-binding HxlR family transcriptional regulator
VLRFKKYFVEILLLLEKSPMSFNELLKTLNAYPDTLNRRLKELRSLNLIVQFEENGKIKYKLTDKGLKLIPLLRNLLKIIDEIKSLLS